MCGSRNFSILASRPSRRATRSLSSFTSVELAPPPLDPPPPFWQASAPTRATITSAHRNRDMASVTLEAGAVEARPVDPVAASHRAALALAHRGIIVLRVPAEHVDERTIV